MRLLTIIFGSFLYIVDPLMAAGPPFDFRADLTGAHPEVVNYGPFKTWNDSHQLTRWGDFPPDRNGQQVVYVQDAGPITSSEIFFMVVEHPEGGRPIIVDHHTFSKAEVSSSYVAAERKFRSKGFKREDIAAVTPVPLPGAVNTLSWRIRSKASKSKIYEIGQDGVIIDVTESTAPTEPHECTPGIEDAESTNDLHHPNDPDLIAFSNIPNASGVHDTAFRLCRRVFKKIPYDMTDNIDLFTDSDSLIVKRLSGMCDEKAVALVSALRANGIPARIKFLIWMRAGIEQAHACVEYYHKQENAWFHLDPTWNEVHNTSAYRNKVIDGEKPTNIMVVDVDWPDDARSPTAITPLVDDKPNDGRLNPWGDFCYSPTMKGEPRPGYSR